MTKSENPLSARSLAEAYLYLMVSPCPSCGKGPLYAGEAVSTRTEGELSLLGISAECGACGIRETWNFLIPRNRLSPATPADAISDGPEPSRIIDVGQWITLSRMIVEAASRSGDKLQIRRFGIESAHCLDEALKFYEPDCDAPPSSAFLTAASRDRFRLQPEQFSRRRLLDLRSKLPTPSRRALR